MNSGWVWISAAGFLLAGFAVTPPETPEQTFKTKAAPLFQKYCGDCHSVKLGTAGVILEGVTDASQVLKTGQTWETAARQLSQKHMPPSQAKQPTEAERELMVSTIELILSKDCRLADAGHVTLRRLNRAEYNNTVRDLCGVDFHPADDFPSDDVGEGFDSIGDVLSISPLLAEKYISAAEKIAEQAIEMPDRRRVLYSGDNLEGDGGVTQNGDVWGLYAYATVSCRQQITKAGTYRITVSAGAQQAGPELAKLAIQVDRDQLDTFQVKGNRELKDYSITTKLKPGLVTFRGVFTNDYYEPNDPNPDNRDRNLIIASITIDGPLELQEQSRSAEKLFGGRLTQENFRDVVIKLATRSYRQPPSTDDVNRLMKLAALAQKDGEPLERGMQLVLQALLSSPKFIFRVEQSDTNVERPLTQYEAASRLSYFLWSSAPDDTLLTLAQQGKLLDPAILKAQTTRMLADPRSKALTKNFAGQWLQLRKLDTVTPDPKTFPEYSDALKESMQGETEAFFDYVVDQNRPIFDFLQSDYTFVDQRLAEFYGIPKVNSAVPTMVKLTDKLRGGLFGQASILTLTSNPTRTSPVKRGKWIMENILGTPPPPPPPNVGTLDEQSAKVTGKTLRARMEMHRTKPECASCHGRLDPFGFALDQFGPIGRARTEDEGYPIDPSSTLADGAKLDGPAGVRSYLMKNKLQFARTLTAKMLTYACGRGMRTADTCHIDTILADIGKRGTKMQDLIQAIVVSKPFLNQGVPK